MPVAHSTSLCHVVCIRTALTHRCSPRPVACYKYCCAVHAAEQVYCATGGLATGTGFGPGSGNYLPGSVQDTLKPPRAPVCNKLDWPYFDPTRVTAAGAAIDVSELAHASSALTHLRLCCAAFRLHSSGLQRSLLWQQ